MTLQQLLQAWAHQKHAHTIALTDSIASVMEHATAELSLRIAEVMKREMIPVAVAGEGERGAVAALDINTGAVSIYSLTNRTQHALGLPSVRFGD